MKPPRVRLVLMAAAALLMIIGAAGYAWAIIQNRHLAASVRASSHTACVADVRQDNAQRDLDIALIAADRAALARLRAIGVRAADRALISFYRAALDARLANVPAKRDPASC